MKNYILLIISLFTFVSCSEKKRERNIKQAYPDYKVARIPGTHFNYLLQSKDGEVFFAESDGFTPVTSQENLILIFKNEK